MKLKTADLPNLLTEMIASYLVFAPQKEGSVSNILPLKQSGDIDLVSIRPNNPAKDVVFPQAEEIYSFNTGQKSQIKEKELTGETIVFGMRACDARGIEILDNFFLKCDRKDGGSQTYEDNYWKKRRELTTIVTIACEKPLNTCACSSLGIHPASEKGSDILLIPDGSNLQVLVVTDKGKKIVDRFKSYFEEGGDPKEAQDRVKKSCEARMSFRLDTTNAGKLMKLWDSDVWKKVSRGCISCGVCTFFCPTCHCFEMRDQITEKDCGKRLKCWDSCHFTPYSLEASGHNPRPDVAVRYRNKLLDKYEYHMTLYGEIACTGCGRCSDFCPAGISLAETLTTLGGAL